MGPGGAPYTTPTQLAQYVPAQVLSLTSPAQQMQACLDASEEFDSYIRGRYQLPLLAWGNDVVMNVSWMAAYHLMQLIGFAPQAGSDTQIVQRYYQVVGWPDKPGTGWAPGIQRQAIHPDVTPTLASPGNPTYDLPQVRTDPIRGWQQFRNGRPVIS